MIVSAYCYHHRGEAGKGWEGWEGFAQTHLDICRGVGLHHSVASGADHDHGPRGGPGLRSGSWAKVGFSSRSDSRNSPQDLMLRLYSLPRFLPRDPVQERMLATVQNMTAIFAKPAEDASPYQSVLLT